MFSHETFDFLRDLRDHNDRAWFEANKARYERVAKAPLLGFVRSVGPYLASVSSHYVADDAARGGSAFRIHRDTRFSKDKSPYKTHLAAQFRHASVRGSASEVVHAPGFYAHISPAGPGEMDGCFAGVGMWRPEGPALAAVRGRIAKDPAAWRAASADMVLAGESLKRVPAPYPADSPVADDLRRKDFIGVIRLDEDALLRGDAAEVFGTAFQRAAPFMRFLCEAIGLAF